MFHAPEYGWVVSAVPRFTPSILNCTEATPTLSDAVAERTTELPETVAPLFGAVIEAVGGVTSGGVAVVTDRVEDFADTLFDASYAETA